METSFTTNRSLRLLYVANILGAGIPGAMTVFTPGLAQTYLFMHEQDPMVMSILGCFWLSVSLFSILGLRNPLAFSAVFLLQALYKSIWLVGFGIPAALSGNLAAIYLSSFFALEVLLFVLFTPYRYLLNEPRKTPRSATA